MRSVLMRLNRTPSSEYIGLSAVVEDPTAAELLVAFAMTPEREAGSIASTARSSLSLWTDERVAAATTSGVNALDLDRLLSDAGTLYLVAPAEEAERCRPLFSALLLSLLRRATTRARAQGGVLQPRLLLALDEAANFARIPRLAGYASSGPGQGIQLLLCYHDLAQVESGYGSEAARTIWNNCRARILLPGQGDLKTLELFSRAIGDETRVYRANQYDRWRSSSSEQRTGRPLATVDELRRQRSAVLLYANAPPAQLELRRWDQVDTWRRLVEVPPPLIAGDAGKGEK
jgi:type IV secretory pathway TraG/TraD family ATPase VirD4